MFRAPFPVPLCLAALLGVFLILNEPRAAGETALIPRKVLFGNPVKSSARISPDGKWISWLAPREGVMNIFVAPADNLEAGSFLTAEKRTIRSYIWTYSSSHLLYIQDQGGNENWHVFDADLKSREVRDLTPFPGVRATVDHVSRKMRDEVIITLNKRDPRYPDLYRLNYRTGELTLVAENPGYFGFLTDDYYKVRFAFKPQPDGGEEYLIARGDGSFQPWLTVAPEDVKTTTIAGANFERGRLYLVSSKDRNTAALFQVDLASGERSVIAGNDKADISGTLLDLETHEPLSYAVNYMRTEHHVLSQKVADDFAFLNKELGPDFSVGSRTEDGQFWIVSAASDLKPGSTYLYGRQSKALKKLYDSRPELSDAPLAAMIPVIIKSRDGLDLVSYLTLPKGAGTNHADQPDKPLPLVLYVHGGPWGRDNFGYSGAAQWLANRGYAVLQVNFRASTGFGKAFVNAGDLEWGRKMDDDLLDAVAWAIGNKIADPARIAIMGGSYGGYATLASLTRNPDTYACGVDIVGPSDLGHLLRTIPPYWAASRPIFLKAIGNPDTPEGQALLNDRSPLLQAGRINKPLLIVQGENDPRVVKAHSDQIVDALQQHHIPVTYVLVKSEGHGFAQPENNIAVNGISEGFLSHCLGGRAEPFHSGEIKGATIEVPAGAGLIEGFGKSQPGGAAAGQR
jgi:dipeptidyl aminopeptidase/acylaminoacyl peptidase